MCNLQFSRKTVFELQRLVPGVSYEVINLITKHVNYSYPAKVEYSLTSKGWKCIESLRNYVDLDSMVG